MNGVLRPEIGRRWGVNDSGMKKSPVIRPEILCFDLLRRTAYSASRTAERVDFITAAPSLTEFGIVLRSYTLTSVTFVAAGQRQRAARFVE